MIDISYSLTFKKNIRKLKKKYRSIKKDIEILLNDLKQGHTPGDQITKTEGTIFKVRLNNSDTKKGKKGGYRVIYYLKTVSSIILVTIYSKLEQKDISPKRINEILKELNF